MRLADVVRAVTHIEKLLLHLARYNWIMVLGKPSFAAKLSHAERACRLFDQVTRLSDFLFRTVQRKSPLIFWSDTWHPAGYISRSGIFLPEIESRILRLEAQIANHTSSLLERLCLATEYRNWYGMISDCGVVGSSGPIDPQIDDEPNIDAKNSRIFSSPRKAITGPQRSDLDKRFYGSYSILSTKTPEFSDRLEDAVPYFWTLAIREAMACDSCALSGVEYDGMPIEFYRDLSKQTWDEARHAEMFLRLSSDLMPEVLSSPELQPWVKNAIYSFTVEGAPLPVPIEGNMYEAMWSADLAPRLILMQIQTEGAAVGRIRRRLKSKLVPTT
jgi:hypothetical protein